VRLPAASCRRSSPVLRLANRSCHDPLFTACALILEQNWSTASGGTKYCQRSAPGSVAGSAHFARAGAVRGSWTSPSRLPTARDNRVVNEVGDGSAGRVRPVGLRCDRLPAAGIDRRQSGCRAGSGDVGGEIAGEPGHSDSA
jgi:hypothetical protein